MDPGDTTSQLRLSNAMRDRDGHRRQDETVAYLQCASSSERQTAIESRLVNGRRFVLDKTAPDSI